MVVTPGASAQGRMLFAKNSDRLLDEAQAVEQHGSADNPPAAMLRCTYLTIPEARRKHAVLIGRPWWMWGAEMGVNEHGVAIGNEAVFARTPPREEPALLGMDLVRLGLERSADAREAIGVITGLLAAHGQGGNCARPGPTYYDNSFLIADAQEAYVLETVGREWMCERIADVRAMSNLYTIGLPTESSVGLAFYLGEAAPADYAEALGDKAQLVTGPERFARATELLSTSRGTLTVAKMMSVLRDHGPEASANWRPRGPRKGRICAHADDAEPRGQTVNSLICEIGRHGGMHWVTGTPAPCLSVFKPVLVDIPLPVPEGPAEAPDSRWWRHDRATRALLASDRIDLASLRAERDKLEANFRDRMATAADADPCEQAHSIEICWAEATALEARWAALAADAMPADLSRPAAEPPDDL